MASPVRVFPATADEASSSHGCPRRRSSHRSNAVDAAATGVTKIADVARLAGRFKLTRQSSARWAPQIATYVEELDFNEDVSTRTSVSFVALGLSATYYILALPFQLSFTSVPRPADFVVSYAVDGITMACLAVEISLHLRRRKRHGSSQGAHGGLKKLVLL